MKVTKDELIPTETNPGADITIKRKINATRMRLNTQISAEKVRQYFWSAMATDNGIDSYHKISNIGAPTFEDVRIEFKKLCGDKQLYFKQRIDSFGMKRYQITTVGHDFIQYECEYEIHDRYDDHNDINKIEFRLIMKGDSVQNWFDFKLAPISNDILKVTDMFIGKDYHRKKGIPEALILEAKKIFSKKIISSSEKYPILISEFRREAATKVWMRLMEKGYAKYNRELDIFELI